MNGMTTLCSSSCLSLASSAGMETGTLAPFPARETIRETQEQPPQQHNIKQCGNYLTIPLHRFSLRFLEEHGVVV